MKPLIVLLVTFAIALLGAKIFNHTWNFIFAGNAAMSVMLLFTAIGHFAYSKGMAMMIPGIIPFKTAIVYLTGLIEVAAAMGLLILSVRHITSLLLIIFFIAIVPANINAAIHKVDYQKGTNEGNDPKYLWFRIPMQLFFIAWVWYFGM
ncbi:MAG: hypothetical protein ACHQFX_13975 [Chitinophagales bacterium]